MPLESRFKTRRFIVALKFKTRRLNGHEERDVLDWKCLLLAPQIDCYLFCNEELLCDAGTLTTNALVSDTNNNAEFQNPIFNTTIHYIVTCEC